MKINGKEVIRINRPKLTKDQMLSRAAFYMAETWREWDEDDREEIVSVFKAYDRKYFDYYDVVSILSDEYPWFKWPWDEAILAN